MSERIAMTESQSIKVIHAALDEQHNEIILRGVIDPRSLHLLKVGDYQREKLTKSKIAALKKALRETGVPDIVLGVRGQNFRTDGDVFWLDDDVYIIDGLQRVSAALELLEAGEEVDLRLGAKFHFGTTHDSERAMFQRINLGQTKLSSNVTISNMRDEVPAADALWRLSHNHSFVLAGRICWRQNKRTKDLITAVTLVKVAGMLHSHAGPGRSTNVVELVNGLQKIMNNIGRPTFVQNVKKFFELVDKAWDFKRVAYRRSAPYLRTTFLLELARVLSDHTNFWEDGKLVYDEGVVKRLFNFPIHDPEIVRLAGTTGTGAQFLYTRFVEALNAGRRGKHRLRPRKNMYDVSADMEDVDELDEEEDS